MVNSVTQLAKAIQSVLQVHANRAGVSTGLIKRVREFTGATFAQTIILGQMQEGEIAMSDLASFARQVGVNVSAQAIDKRFTEKTALFFAELLNAAFTQVVAADPVAIPLLERFSEVIVEDSTTLSLPDELEKIWQGCGNATESAKSAFKMQVRWDLLTGAFKGQTLTDGRVPDTRSPLRLNRRQRRSLRIVDLGYFDTQQFQKDSERGEYWISRLKGGGSLQIFDDAGNPLNLYEVLSAYAGRSSYECAIQVSATTRLPARLIAYPVPEEVVIKRQESHYRKAQKHSRKPSKKILDLCGWTLIITNIPAEELNHQEALVLLRARWQIELLFKLWKQYAQADVSRSKNSWHILCDFYAKLIGMIIVHWMMIIGCWQVPNRSMVKAAKAIRKQIVLIARALIGREDLDQILQEITQGLDRCRIDKRKKHPNTFQLLLDPTLQQTDLPVSGGAGGP
jgi:Transposase DDE domain